MYIYSANDNAFYAVELKPDYINAGTWPDDGIGVSEVIFHEFARSAPPEGKYRVAGTDGLPVWADIPPPPPAELRQRAESQKQYLMNAARDKIAPLQDAVDLDIATDAEKSALTDWRKYRVLLNRVDCSTAPDIQWPEQPK
ncbi:tail fiber assembly protein [Xenorhabdus sp. Vera]|uniref:tail fiber assembly protein n=1 Tax=Xenorhabdus koppenhoeferi TaxID=351659 RepID=UPI0019AD0639|nr:tail fiber assembly protein [Xenorhabdus sp. Vera]MBD2809869.1 tail fiber assembly protein [Xenorhabdus sp. Vera]